MVLASMVSDALFEHPPRGQGALSALLRTWSEVEL